MSNIYKRTLSGVMLILFFFGAMQPALAQNGVRIAGTSGTADPSAMLDIVSTNKGVLFPRVCLASLTANSSPVTNPQAGLVIYNTGGCGIAATGLYFWNGSSWVFLNTGGFSAAGTTNYHAKFTASNAIGNSVVYDDGTNVGIGTAGPVQKLQVGAGNNDGILVGNYNDQLGWNGTGTAPQYSLRFAGYRDVVGNFVGAKIAAIRTNICCSGLSQGMELAFFTQEATASAAGDANLTERMRIGNGGNVGIGVTTPLQALDVNGEIIRKVAIAQGYNQQDGTDNGVIASRVLTYTKKYGAGVTGLRVTYSDGFRTYTGGTSAKACRWEVRFNGVSCGTPGPVAYDVYEEATNQNFHHSATVCGTCKNLAAGTYTVQVYVSPAPGYPVCDCYTGWQGMWELMVEEVRY